MCTCKLSYYIVISFSMHMHMADLRDLRALGLVIIGSFQKLGRRYDSQFMLALMFYKLQMSFCSFLFG